MTGMQALRVAASIALGLAVGILLHFAPDRLGFPVQPNIHQAFRPAPRGSLRVAPLPVFD